MLMIKFSIIFMEGLDKELYSEDVNGLSYEPFSCFFTEHFQKPLFRRKIINCIIIVITKKYGDWFPTQIIVTLHRITNERSDLE